MKFACHFRFSKRSSFCGIVILFTARNIKLKNCLYCLVGHANPTLRSPALTHERPYGMHSLPSAFSMMGRRPTLSHSSPDFLSQDPMLASQPSLSPSSHLHSGIGSATGAPPWSWMPPHPHIASPDFFQTHISSGWLGHDHDRSRERIEDCLFTSPRSHAPPLINGAGSTASFSPGSGIFYPHAPTSTPPVHSFQHHSSGWSNHNNHTQRASFDHGENHDDLFSLPMRPRHTSMSSDDGSKNLVNKHNELPTYLHVQDRRMDHQKETYHDRSSADSTGVMSTSHYQDKTLPLQPTSSVVKGVNTNKISPISKPTKEFSHYEQKPVESKSAEESKKTTPVVSPSYVQTSRTEGIGLNKQTTEGSAFSLPPSSQDSKILPPPPKLTKTKAPPPPRLQVPKSILNDREAVVPQISPKSSEKSKTSVESITQKTDVNSAGKKSSLNSNEPVKEQKLSASKEALLQKLKERPILQQTQADVKKPSTVKETLKPSQTKPSSTKPASASRVSSTPSLTSPPKIPSGKPLHMARFRLPYNNEDTSDEESDSSEASSESGSGSDGSEEGEGKEEEETGSGSDSESDSDGSENEEAGDDDEDDDDDEEESSGIICSQEDNHSGSLYVKEGLPTTATGMCCVFNWVLSQFICYWYFFCCSFSNQTLEECAFTQLDDCGL